jgi:hypothetical protein
MDGPQAIDERDTILMAMARELVTDKGIGESADAVWKRLVEKQAEVFGVHAAEASPSEIETEPSAVSVPESIIPPAAPIPGSYRLSLLAVALPDPISNARLCGSDPLAHSSGGAFQPGAAAHVGRLRRVIVLARNFDVAPGPAVRRSAFSDRLHPAW